MKRMLMSIVLVGSVFLAAFWAIPSQAQSSMSGGEIVNPERVIPFAKNVEHALAERGARVAIVSRVGRDPDRMPSGIEYTHVALWVYSDIQTEDGRTVRGYAIHNLYQLPDDPGKSDLVQDFPVEFFGNVFELRAGVIVPTADLQDRLLQVLNSSTYEALHQPDYSLVANPFGSDYQNCTNFVLSVLMAAIYETDNRDLIDANIEAYFEPQTVRLGPLQRAFGPLFVRGVETSDHSGAIRTSTFGSLSRFMRAYKLSDTDFTITERGVLEQAALAN
ncbi:DUF2145 domain-containing protein [Pyruvatibacter mobilis]|mgnify:CR=1 FL=1|uniref:DUF2145 domain-containing protein n=1 Tax=Pyruvatibacter mobilis TaxID=1712261 RepID=UPI003BACE260